jgi:hypothetical protein
MTIMQHVTKWWRTEFKQPFRTTNAEKQEKHPVVIFTVHQYVEEAHLIRDEWRGKPEYQVRCYERQLRVDNIITSAFITVVRRRRRTV